MRTNVLLLFVAVVSLATFSNLVVAEKAVHQVQDPQHPLKSLRGDSSARNLKGSHEMAKTDVADEVERGYQQVKSILDRGDPNKLSKKNVQKVRSYAEENPDKWLFMSNYLEYFYGISFLALMAGGALWHGMQPAGAGGPKIN
ncbi:hypothetical protein PHYSODRAFT_284422 [Phytophthora sojae]|uniref:RxLR effector protein n=2 Tax=Phytophthora sojae TaxID=67593 RepID=G4YQ39_PHYSP|nr:hypothetical protein PHYSODRAFT_284422 [Phytophthora sojae]AEK81294.1 Avh383 [Phytophthora sojae]AEK81295.1 Avh383 [Phytophthora sojae]AEK81296.1 Avh383 [Phytophthora sojae]EGZ29354.1 hypothetical protein PHYSODRAFT_284422 [Phytophthora sojae]|eukprot:XP_009516629.1 hypothetical protein PHYSODRAFT_284422 [Phytophthora sojae]